jgi:anti-sigma regulatory factor (Ser/Thr protein kinase)
MRKPAAPPIPTDTIRFAAVPSAVPCARAFVLRFTQRWRLAAVRDNAELVTSELVTNAVKATGVVDPKPTYAMLATVAVFVLRLSVVGSCLRIEVWDRSLDLPKQQDQDDESEHGRGLLLVDALTVRSGVRAAVDGTGKVVWADLPLDGSSAPDRESEVLPLLPKRTRTIHSADPAPANQLRPS